LLRGKPRGLNFLVNGVKMLQPEDVARAIEMILTLAAQNSDVLLRLAQKP